jgi:DNA-binding IclR family transcriptional regulator
VNSLTAAQRTGMLEDIEHIRAVGHCSAMSTPGVVAVSAPVFDEYGMCATVAVVGTDNTLSQADDAGELLLVVDTARQLTKEMGGRYLPDQDMP